MQIAVSWERLAAGAACSSFARWPNLIPNGIRKRSPSMPAGRSIRRPARWRSRFIFPPLSNAERTAVSRAASITPRSDNPNRAALERGLAAIEGGARAAAFSSGVAAATALFQTLSPNDHVVAPQEAYHGVLRLLREVFARWQLAVDFVDMTDLGAIEKALRPETKLIWVETPSNPTLRLTDIAAVAALARPSGALLACDNTWAPTIQRPFALGADVVMHSTTKYFGGHSDVLGGALIVREEDDFFQRLRDIQKIGGAVPAPFDCWLIHRGMQTLACRLRTQCENAARVAAFLEAHPKVARVHYPGLPSHPQHALAQRQMTEFGAMISVEIKGGGAAAQALPNECQVFTPRDQSGRSGKLNRAPLLDRRPDYADSAQSPPALHRVGASG